MEKLDVTKLNLFHSQRQLKRKISEWHLDKNVKGPEMKSIVRKQARLKIKGKTVAFRVRGRAVAQNKINRWEKRPGNSQAAFITQQVAGSRKLETHLKAFFLSNTLS